LNELNNRLRDELKVTQVVVTHDMNSAFTIADRITFLYQGKVRCVGTPRDIQESTDPVVQQFIKGETVGPMQIDAGDPTAKKADS
ncbi:MAG TPA: ABC transporter ATP-binding protein, partial [Leptospiraceae bacterium]|nr:ABC transporter ATP-binding protein [Leptospiraceae bacterium]